MTNKILYKAKIVNNKIKLFAYEVRQHRCHNRYKFVNKTGSCFKSDVGVVVFWTQREAFSHLIKTLKHSIMCGEKYLKKEKNHLKEAKKCLKERKLI